MNDQPVEGPGQEEAPPPAAPPPKQSFRDRTWSLAQLIAVALAAVILGGLGGAAVASAAGGDDERRGPGRFERGGPNGPPGMHWRQKQRMKEWKQEHRLPPPGPPPNAPAPSPPTPSTPTPSG